MRLLNVIARLCGRRRIEEEMDEEMQFHLEHLTQRHLERGLAPAAARRAALAEFGGLDQAKEEVRDAWGIRLLFDLIRDLRLAARSLLRTPGFAAVAILTLALGIGVNAVMFSFVRDAVLRPVLRNHQLQLTAIFTRRADADQGWRLFSYREFETLHEQTDVVRDVAVYSFDIVPVGEGQELTRRAVGIVSQNYFELLQAEPFAGRFFTAVESRPGASLPVAVADYGFWERAGKPANFIGRTFRVNQRDVTIIGIAPKGFLGLHASIGPDLWLPLGELHHLSGHDLYDESDRRLSPIARLAPGLTFESVGPRLPAFAQTLWGNAASADDADKRQLLLAPPSTTGLQDDEPTDESFLGLFGLLSMGLSSVVLVVACLNLANLLLARGASRRQEIALRLSLGASRSRIVRQLATEGLLLALLGGGLGLLLSAWADGALTGYAARTFAVSKFSFNAEPFLDATTLLVTLGFCGVATVLTSLGPALRLTRPNLIDDIKRPRGSGARRGPGSLSNGLVVLQIAFSLALLFSATLFIQSAHLARYGDPGFQTAGQLVANLDYRLTDLSADQIDARQRELLTQLRARFPGATVTTASTIPFNFDVHRRSVYPLDALARANPDTDELPHARAAFTAVGPDYFSLLHLNLLRGRTFNAQEDDDPAGPRVVVIDQTLATFLFGDSDPIGQSLYLDADAARAHDASQTFTVVGVVQSPREQVFADAPRRFYRPLAQVHTPNLFLHLGPLPAATELPRLRRALQSLEPDTPILFVRTLSSFLEQNLNTLVVELCGMVFGAFGLIALILAIAGVYGVKSHQVAQRTREIGIRLAIGAKPGQVIAQILRQGLTQALVGIALGLGLALAANRVLASMLLQGPDTNGLVLTASAAVLAGSVFFACWLPARRAARVDPAVTLKAE